ncbi:hypothetical protein LCGC14_0545600 [marine sediment metagenome]|uniref:Uncharacterized protein n=1 Tax=marine sediment metagenome TaxID=412755 RepID=A0A0F9RRG4_9ZZZZ
MLQISTVSAKGYRTLQTPSAVKFGETQTNANNYHPTAMGSSVVSVGLIEGPVSINQNPEIQEHRSDQLYNPYEAKMAGLGYQVEFSLDQYDVYNLALYLSINDSEVDGESILSLRGREYFSDLRCMEIETDAPRVDTTVGLGSQNWQFWKVRAFSNGAVEFGRGTQTRQPMIVYCLANDLDQVGEVVFSAEYGIAPAYG